MSIREVFEKRRRILVVVGVGALLVLLLCVQLSVTFHRRWLAYLGAIVFIAAGYLNTAWLRCPRCHRSIGFARERPRKFYCPSGSLKCAPIAGFLWKSPGTRRRDFYSVRAICDSDSWKPTLTTGRRASTIVRFRTGYPWSICNKNRTLSQLPTSFTFRLA
jgi:hypothetical protein